MSVGRDGRVDGWATAGGKLGYLVIGPRAWPMAREPDNHPFGPNGTGPDGSVRDGSGEDFRAMTHHRPGQPTPRGNPPSSSPGFVQRPSSGHDLDRVTVAHLVIAADALAIEPR